MGREGTGDGYSNFDRLTRHSNTHINTHINTYTHAYTHTRTHALSPHIFFFYFVSRGKQTRMMMILDKMREPKKGEWSDQARRMTPSRCI